MSIISRSITPTARAVTGRTIEGHAYGYALPSFIADEGAPFYEQMLRGCDTKTIRDRAAMGRSFPLYVFHSRTVNRGLVPPDEIGQVTFTPRDDALEFAAVVSRGRVADEILEMVRDDDAEDLASDVSVSYKDRGTIPGTHDGYPLYSRAEIALVELSICPTGTAKLEGSGVLAVRAARLHDIDAEHRRRLRMLDL